jgi:hypothetical protein
VSRDNQHRRIFLGMPGYGQLTAGAALGFYRCCADVSRVTWNYQEASLLAANFNRLWCTALNLQRNENEPLAYFAMQHADIEPMPYWLDVAIAELERNKLDVLGVVAPIKDDKGLTSIALHREGDNWRPLCRLTMEEVYRLPATFTSEDVGHPLLINTGCWVCRFDPAWNDQVHFTINDRIVKTPDGRYMPQVEPEDWFVSRLFHELGLRVGVTRKVQLLHRGDTTFTNCEPWGTERFDTEYIGESLIPENDVAFPHEVDGWLSVAEGEALRELARGKRVLEIGSYCGRSTICLAQSAEHVTAVDAFDGTGTPEPRDTYDDFLSNIRHYGVEDKIEIVHPTAEVPLPQYDLAFIDGAHDFESVRADIEKSLLALKPDGLLAFHDYRLYAGEWDGRWDAGVTQAVNELLEAGGELLERYDSLALIRPPVHWLSTSNIPLEV